MRLEGHSENKAKLNDGVVADGGEVSGAGIHHKKNVCHHGNYNEANAENDKRSLVMPDKGNSGNGEKCPEINHKQKGDQNHCEYTVFKSAQDVPSPDEEPHCHGADEEANYVYSRTFSYNQSQNSANCQGNTARNQCALCL